MKIFIIMRDRLEPVLKLLPWLEGHEVHYVDNQSTYKPLLRFYETQDQSLVHRIGRNHGHTSPWDFHLVPENEKYIVTDPDVVPDPSCPKDFIQVMIDILDAEPDLQKVGFGLRIDDLPDHYTGKQSAINHERGFWGCRRDVLGYQGHEVPIDTTFAMYREGALVRKFCSPTDTFPALRLGPPYVAQHLAWYADSENPTEEEVYYKANANPKISNWLYDKVSESHK
jgi:hypothetical protein